MSRSGPRDTSKKLRTGVAPPPRKQSGTEGISGAASAGPCLRKKSSGCSTTSARRPPWASPAAVFRLRDRRIAARGAGGELAGGRLGSERGPLRRHADRRRCWKRFRSRWLLDVLALPAGCGRAFVTGATMANFTALAAARARGARRAPAGTWKRTGSSARRRSRGGRRRGAPVADQGARHARAGTRARGARAGGRAGPHARRTPARVTGRRSFACRRATSTPARSIRPRRSAAGARAGAWVHVDGAFGLWAAASPRYAHLVDGRERGRFVGDRRAQVAERAL